MTHPRHARPDSRLLVLLLTSLVSIGPLSTDMYLPALPDLAADFSVSAAAAQATLSFFLLGFAAAQLVVGPLSDRFGRKPVLLGGLGIYVAASVLAVYATSMDMLIAVRFAQAAGACAGGVLGRTVVRDLFERADAARMLATLGLIMAVAPMVAPIIGGYVVVWAGWGAVFWLMAAGGTAIFLAIYFYLPETNAYKNPHALHIGPMLATYRHLLGTRLFVGYLLANGFVFGGMFAFITNASFLMAGTYGVPPQRFGLYFAIAVAGYMVGNLLTRSLAHKWDTDRLIGIGIGLALAGSGGGTLLVLAGGDGPWQLSLFVALYLAGLGLVLPNSMAGALQPYPAAAGAASALLGFALMIFAALAGFAIGAVHDGTALPTTLIMTGMAGVSLLAFFGLVWKKTGAA